MTSVALSSGDILAYTWAFSNILFNTNSYFSLFLKMLLFSCKILSYLESSLFGWFFWS
jgi:hypothetical protein